LCRQHIFIPLLPSKLLVYLTAPTPYLVGLRRYMLDEAKRSGCVAGRGGLLMRL